MLLNEWDSHSRDCLIYEDKKKKMSILVYMPNQEFDFDFFKDTVGKIKAGGNAVKAVEIEKLLKCDGLKCHFQNNDTGRGVYSIHEHFEYEHERITAFTLTAWDYDIVFIPGGYFPRGSKKFDVFLCRDYLMFECDLKSITSSNPDTVADRIVEGSFQASRLIIDIQSNIKAKDLIDGLRSGSMKNTLLKEIMLIYKGKFQRLFKSEILKDGIYEKIK